MNNGRFAISMHILTLLTQSVDEWCPSELLAGSININAVLVRKELINLRQHGFVVSKEGKNGGSMLAKPAKQIRLSDVYSAVRSGNLLGQSKSDPNPDCPIGKEINKQLGALYEDVEQTLLRKLGKTTLADFCKQFER